MIRLLYINFIIFLLLLLLLLIGWIQWCRGYWFDPSKRYHFGALIFLIMYKLNTELIMVSIYMYIIGNVLYIDVYTIHFLEKPWWCSLPGVLLMIKYWSHFFHGDKPGPTTDPAFLMSLFSLLVSFALKSAPQHIAATMTVLQHTDKTSGASCCIC